jgi:site-specific DNA-methyltransferase (adenine-specific)
MILIKYIGEIMSDIQLYNGDCLKVMDNLIQQGIKVDAIITDIPYGTTRCKWDSVIPFEEMWKRIKEIRKPTTPIVLFGSEPFSSSLRLSNIKEYKYDWKWEKTQATGFFNAKKQPMRCIEDICVFYQKQCLYNPQKTEGHKPVNSYTKYLSTVNKTEVYGKCTKELSGGGNTDRFPRQLLTYSSDKQTCYLHPTQKPLELMEYLVKTYSNENDLVLDFTMGSGTTGVACKKLNRNFIGIELDENYFKIAKERINNE